MTSRPDPANSPDSSPDNLPDGSPANSLETWAVIAASGTAGHVYPGIAVAQTLYERGLAVHFAVAATGVGSQGVLQAGFGCTLIAGRGLRRSLRPKAALANLVSAGRLLAGAWQLFRLLGQHRPKVVLAMGGYTGFIAAAAAFVRRIPVVTAEQNAVPGLANKLAARVSKAVGVAFADTKLPKAVHTGNPVRQEVIAAARAAKAATAGASEATAAGVPEATAAGAPGVAPFKVIVLGGSLGAGCINEAMAELLDELSRQPETAAGYSWLHITGERHWEQLEPLRTLAQQRQLNYTAVPFAHNLAERLADSQVVAGRSGAGMVAELAALGLPSVLIPLHGAPGDHQTANAQALVSAGAAVLVSEPELSGSRLLAELEQLRHKPAQLAAMSQAAAGLARVDAAENMAELLQRYAKA